MQSTLIPAPAKPTAPSRGLQFLIEPEPWLRVFTRNFADLFRPSPPPVWVTAKPADYWPDALVHRPVAWRSARQSFLGHTLVILAVYAINLAWLNQPQIVPEQPPHNTTLHYELSEYLPAVTPHTAKPGPPARCRERCRVRPARIRGFDRLSRELGDPAAPRAQDGRPGSRTAQRLHLHGD